LWLFVRNFQLVRLVVLSARARRFVLKTFALRRCVAVSGFSPVPCFHPLTGYRSKAGRNAAGKWPVVFNLVDGISDEVVTLPCGNCVGCRLERSRQWAMRCVHEASLYSDNCFLTLTYNEVSLQYLDRRVDLDTGEIFSSLNKRDIMLFMKRLRKRFGDGIRFFQCGEYGSQFSRPHHHVLLFNFDFKDKYFCERRNGVDLFRSPSLEELWPYGFSRVGQLTFESAAYVARYILKKINGDQAEEHYNGLLPEFITMSRRPGISRGWIDKWMSDVYPQDLVIMRDMKLKPPRYYDQIYDKLYPFEMDDIRAKRMERRLLKKEDFSWERRSVLEKVVRLNLRFKRRCIE